MRYRMIGSAVLLLALTVLFQPSRVMAGSNSCVCEQGGNTCECEKTLEQVAEDWSNRCKCSAPDISSYTYTETSVAVAETETRETEEEPRYIEIHRDESFIYWMDKKTARYLPIPHMAKEKMIDVWIKLEPLEFLEGEYTYPAKYYLEHYLIRPKRQQIQFLAEMEVKGRPSSESANRRYDGRLWENLIPGSIEDTIYHAVLRHKGAIYDESSSNGTAIRDFIENTVNISL